MLLLMNTSLHHYWCSLLSFLILCVQRIISQIHDFCLVDSKRVLCGDQNISGYICTASVWVWISYLLTDVTLRLSISASVLSVSSNNWCEATFQCSPVTIVTVAKVNIKDSDFHNSRKCGDHTMHNWSNAGLYRQNRLIKLILKMQVWIWTNN